MSNGESDLVKAVRAESHKANPSAIITLFELRQTNQFPGLPAIIFRFTSSVESDGPVVFAGHEYIAISVEAEDFELKSSGTLAEPRIRIGIVGTTIGSSLRLYDDFINWEVKRIRTYRTFLDNGDTPDPSATMPIDSYRVEKKASQTLEAIEWELQAVIDQEGINLPRRQVLRDFCSHTYRTWDPIQEEWNYTNVTCPYTGETSYSEDNGIAQNERDACGRTVRSCTTRFGRAVSLPTTAFPGAGT